MNKFSAFQKRKVYLMPKIILTLLFSCLITAAKAAERPVVSLHDEISKALDMAAKAKTRDEISSAFILVNNAYHKQEAFVCDLKTLQSPGLYGREILEYQMAASDALERERKRLEKSLK